MNPAKLLCSCKGFRHIGICSHCIACNHWTQELDLNKITVSLEGEKKSKKRAGYMKGVRPALIKESITKKKAKPSKKANKQLTQRK